MSTNEEAVNFAFAGDHVSLVITGIDITKVGIGMLDASAYFYCSLTSQRQPQWPSG